MKTLMFDEELKLDGKGNLLVLTGIEGLKEKVLSRLQLWKGSWFLDITAGVPYLQEILGVFAVDKCRLVRGIIGNEILKEPDVISIVESSCAEGERDVAVVFKLKTVYGKTEVKYG